MPLATSLSARMNDELFGALIPLFKVMRDVVDAETDTNKQIEMSFDLFAFENLIAGIGISQQCNVEGFQSEIALSAQRDTGQAATIAERGRQTSLRLLAERLIPLVNNMQQAFTKHGVNIGRTCDMVTASLTSIVAMENGRQQYRQ